MTALAEKGGVALDEAQLKTLLEGKAIWVRNTVTGEEFKVSYNTNGQSNVWHVGKNAMLPSGVGNVAKSGYQGTTSPYTIENGKVVMMVSQEPYSVTVYKLGDTYYGARSNEFGYANYEILQKPPLFLNPLDKGEAAEEHAPVSPGPVKDAE